VSLSKSGSLNSREKTLDLNLLFVCILPPHIYCAEVRFCPTKDDTCHIYEDLAQRHKGTEEEDQPRKDTEGFCFYVIMCIIRKLFPMMEVQMLVIAGVFENDRFIPDSPVSIPQKKKVTVTIDEELPAAANGRAARRAIFDKCRLDLTDFNFDRDEANDYD